MMEPLEGRPGEGEALADLVGTVLGERYQLERMLGAGGMGAVFAGRDLRLGRAVAVKVMQPGYARDAEYSKRFLREAQATSKVRHRNVVVVLDYGEAKGGRVYLVMEFLVGQDLEQFLRGQPEQRIAWPQACGLLVQIASGLRAAHEEGVIHRDVKPANCFLTTEDDEPVVKVVDFGIAKLEAGMQTQQLTGTGNVLGTPSYTAPEMVLTGGPASPRSDVYSLGVVAYRMLTGRLPFTGKTAFEVMHHACIHAVPSLREQGVELPEGVEALVMAMLAKAPDERPADMGELRRRLLTLARDAGGVPVVVAGAGSSSVRIEVDAGGSGASGEVVRTEVRTAVLDSGSERRPATEGAAEEDVAAIEVERTAVMDSGQREPSGGAAGLGGGVEPVAAEPERTAVVVGAGVVEPSGGPLAAPGGAPVDGEASAPPRAEAVAQERTEVLDSGLVARPQGTAARWWIGVAAAVVVIGGAAWGWMGTRGPDGATTGEAMEASVKAVNGSEPVAVVDAEPVAEPVQPETELAGDVVADEPEAEGQGVDADEPEAEGQDVADDEPEAEGQDVAGDEPRTTVEPTPSPDEPTVSEVEPKKVKVPAGPPPDAALTKRLGRKIKKSCASELAGGSVTVYVTVTASGTIKRLTAMPKGAAEACAKRQVQGTRWRTRTNETDLEIGVRG